MDSNERRQERVQLEVSLEVLCRLLRERNLVASEVAYLNAESFAAGRRAVKSSLCTEKPTRGAESRAKVLEL